MRKDLLDWEQALTLAKRLAPDEMSYIYLEYGNQLEMDGNSLIIQLTFRQIWGSAFII